MTQGKIGKKRLHKEVTRIRKKNVSKKGDTKKML